jgi:hypothetical protein
MFTGSWPVFIIRREYPRYMAVYVDSIRERENGMVRNRVFCPHLCPLDYQCPLWRKPICTLKAVAYVVPEEDKDMPFRIFFKWEAARDFALEKAKRIREREETLYHFEKYVSPSPH